MNPGPGGGGHATVVQANSVPEVCREYSTLDAGRRVHSGHGAPGAAAPNCAARANGRPA